MQGLVCQASMDMQREVLLTVPAQLQVIVLSPDAELPLSAVDSNAVLIICGIIDQTVIKYQSLAFAQRHGFEVCCHQRDVFRLFTSSCPH